ncbi:hypothetical protein niasHT_017112 [Heterodera trifolii]|uniref:Uncharacterized protein n=1 Tax=Heterodera trifolii TaxID=157864 RepID=A0ABD2LEB0_9BILA
MSDSRKEAEEKMAKAIFISADCWLCVFDLITPFQLGLGIALISHRFDYYVDEHFKTRKWILAFIRIGSKIGENGTKGMEITSLDGKPMPIPQIQLPRKVIGFRRITINYIDRNAIAFIHRFRPIFAASPINLIVTTTNDRISEFILRNIRPMIRKNICGMRLSADTFYNLRQFVPSILNDCPSLRVFFIYYNDFFAEFPCDDSAAASDGQAVTKWLFTPLQNDVPKLFKCAFDATGFCLGFFSRQFIVFIWIPPSFDDSVFAFELTNELTREQLMLKENDNNRRFLLVRCPIARDESKLTKWEEEEIDWEFFDQSNQIDIHIYDEDDIGDGLLDATPGPSDQQKK